MWCHRSWRRLRRQRDRFRTIQSFGRWTGIAKELRFSDSTNLAADRIATPEPVLLFEQISKVMRDIKLSLEFQERSPCLPKKLPKLPSGEATLAFCDARSNRSRCPAYLRGQSEAFGSWGEFSFLVNNFSQAYRFLLSDEVARCSAQSHLSLCSSHQSPEFLELRAQEPTALPILKHHRSVTARNPATLKTLKHRN